MNKCEAAELAKEGWEDDLEPCDEDGTVPFADRWLCRGCFEALEAIRMASRASKREPEDNNRS